MSILPTLTSLSQPPIDCGWLWALRITTLLYLAIVLAALALLFQPLSDFRLWYVLALLAPSALLYVLWDLRRNPPEKFGLALATAFGALPGTLITLSALFLTWDFLSMVRQYQHWSDTVRAWVLPSQALILVMVAVAFIQRARSRSLGTWLWALRILAASSVFCAALALHASVQQFLRLGVLDWKRVVFLAGGALAYAAVLWGLGRGRDDARTKQALVVAGCVGATVLALFVGGRLLGLGLAADLVDWAAEDAIVLMLLAWGVAILFSSFAGIAIRIYYLLGREPGDRLRLVGGFATVILAGLTMAAVASEKVNHARQDAYAQSSAVGALRTINTAEITYASTYNHGFSPSLAALGPAAEGVPPSESASGLIDEVLATGRRSRYTFIYTPGQPDEKGFISTYAVCARTMPSKRLPRDNFFTDQSGIIRSSNEDRCATAKDPPLPD